MGFGKWSKYSIYKKNSGFFEKWLKNYFGMCILVCIVSLSFEFIYYVKCIK